MEDNDVSLQDILVDIHYLDLGFVSGIFRNHEQLCFASCCAANGFTIKHVGLKCHPIHFMSPFESWKENGTFFVLIETEFCYEIGIFTPYLENINKVHDSIFSTLLCTRKINYCDLSRYVVFKHIHHSLHYVLMTYIKARNLEVERDDRYYICKLPKETALQFDIRVPDEVEMIPLRRENAQEILTNWPDKYPNSNYIRNLIKVSGGYGLISKKDGKLLSWGLKTMMGTIDFVQTIKEYQRKHYASIIVKMLAREVAQQNQHPVAIIRLDDAISYTFLERLGFKNVGLCHNVQLKLKSFSFTEKIRRLTQTTANKIFKTIKKPSGLNSSSQPGPSWAVPSNFKTLGTPPFKRTPPKGGVLNVFKKKNISLNLLTETLTKLGESGPYHSRSSNSVTTVAESSFKDEVDDIADLETVDVNPLLTNISPPDLSSTDTSEDSIFADMFGIKEKTPNTSNVEISTEDEQPVPDHVIFLTAQDGVDEIPETNS